MHLQGKNAVITGGMGGIGLAVARHFLVSGIEKIALLDLNYHDDMMKMLGDMFPQKEIVFRLTNVRDKNDVDRAFEEVMIKFQSIDCLVACAGVLNEINYQTTVEVNLLGFIHTNYAAMKHMTIAGGGTDNLSKLIINISSVAGIDCSYFCSPVYNATKHGVVAFTRSMGDDYFYQATGIKFIVVCPGTTLTPLLSDLDGKVISADALNVVSQRLKHMPKQSVDEFAVALLEIIKVEKNGSVWLVDGGKFKEINISNPWFDNNTQKTNE